METILGLVLMMILLVGGCCLFFLIFVQPIWGVVDVAVSKVHSGGTKDVVILLTGCSLYPIDPRSGDCRPVRPPGVGSHHMELGTAHASPPITPTERQRGWLAERGSIAEL